MSGGMHFAPRTREQLDAAVRRNIEDGRANRGMNPRVGKTGRRRMAVDLDLVMNAVDGEGPEVLSNAADGYWEDMRRRCPWIDTDPDIQRPARRHGKIRTRYGNVTARKVY